MLINITKSLLLIIDLQNDFCPNGALAVPEGDSVITPLNALSCAFAAAGGFVAATQDWHPEGHHSFASAHQGKKPGDTYDEEILWPDHCVQGEWGSAFHERLNLSPVNLIIRKGFRRELDSYSAFFENDRRTPTGLDGWLVGVDANTVVIGGLATDYCVFYSAMDSKKLGFNTIVVNDAVRGVGYPEGSVENAIKQMSTAGIIFADSADILKEIG